MSEAEGVHYSVPIEHVKNYKELAQEIDLHAAFIVQEATRRGMLQLTLDGDDALELASTLLQAASIIRSKKEAS